MKISFLVMNFRKEGLIMASKLYSLSAADNYIQKVSNELLDIITLPGSLLDTYILIHISGVVEVLEET